MEHDQKFAHACDEDDLVGFAFLFQTRGEFTDDGIVAIGHQSRHINGFNDRPLHPATCVLKEPRMGTG